MSSGEQNDLFVVRKPWVDPKNEEKINAVFAVIKDKSIDCEERDYTVDNISRVRIPALLYLLEQTSNMWDFSDYFETKYHKQVGAHLLAAPNGMVCSLKTFLDEKKAYKVGEARPINDVYPCFVKKSDKIVMVLGLRFTRNPSEGYRSFGRTQDNQTPSSGVFDITEDFLDPELLKKSIDSPERRQMFPSGGQHYCIYVGAGAKLIVDDDRFDVMKQNEGTKAAVRRNRSLLQSGALLVVSGDLKLQLPVRLKDETRKKGVARESYDWKTVDEKDILKPEEDLYQKFFTQRKLHELNEQVIILGAGSSQHNSICWRIRIKCPKSVDNNRVFIHLIAPEGGRIIDIQPWDWGLAEVYWRHRYERLYEKVLFSNKTGAYAQKPQFTYITPNIGGSNPFYWAKKVLGIGVNHMSWRIKHTYEYKDQPMSTIPAYYERHTNRTDFSTPPYPEPLYPPIYADGKYKYLPHRVRPQFSSDAMVIIEKKLYKIIYKDFEMEYQWVDPKRVTLSPLGIFSEHQRLGVDLMVYTKNDKHIGSKKMICFEMNSIQVISEEDLDKKSSENKSEINSNLNSIEMIAEKSENKSSDKSTESLKETEKEDKSIPEF